MLPGGWILGGFVRDAVRIAGTARCFMVCFVSGIPRQLICILAMAISRNRIILILMKYWMMDDALADVDVEMTHHITPAVTMEANTQWNPSTPNLHIQICIFIHHYGPIIFCYSVIHLTDLVSSEKGVWNRFANISPWNRFETVQDRPNYLIRVDDVTNHSLRLFRSLRCLPNGRFCWWMMMSSVMQHGRPAAVPKRFLKQTCLQKKQRATFQHSQAVDLLLLLLFQISSSFLN